MHFEFICQKNNDVIVRLDGLDKGLMTPSADDKSWVLLQLRNDEPRSEHMASAATKEALAQLLIRKYRAAGRTLIYENGVVIPRGDLVVESMYTRSPAATSSGQVFPENSMLSVDTADGVLDLLKFPAKKSLAVGYARVLRSELCRLPGVEAEYGSLVIRVPFVDWK